jgi:choline dehydrogenase-like flavoprotein
MIHDVEELEAGADLQAQVGVVGSGLAGLEVARYLGQHGVQVVVLESGRRDFDPATQELARVESIGKLVRTPDPDSDFNPYLPPIFRGETRLRQFGGTSNIWTGKWREFDRSDFEQRPWIPHSGWPIDYEEMRRWYAEVQQAYGFAAFDAFNDGQPFRRLTGATAAAELEPRFHFWEKEATRPAKRFREELAASSCTRIVLGATATELLPDEEGGRVEKVVFKSPDGRPFTLSATHFVLAAGGLEEARLLLASSRRKPAGIGNDHDLVGRFYMDHPKYKHGRLLPGQNFALIPGKAATQPRPRFQVSFGLSEAVQRRASLTKHALYLHPVYRHEIDYPKAQVAALESARRAGRPDRFVLKTLALAASPSAFWKIVQAKLWRHAGSVAYCRASICVEQVPNPTSRLLLSAERDSLGMPKLIVDWRLTELDRQSFDVTIEQLSKGFAAAGLGELTFGNDLTIDQTTDCAHHMGATRMGKSPETGVVDRDCRVFGTKNVFIASASVFPTGHCVAPTLTIVSLARRLGDHLRKAIAPGRGAVGDEGVAARRPLGAAAETG